MNRRNSDLTTGPLARQILAFSIPLMLSNALQVMFNMADVAVLGQFVGSGALGSVGSTTILVSLFTGLLIGMSVGINILTALHIGAKHRRDVVRTVHTAAVVSLIYGTFLMVVGVVFARSILELLHTKEELIEDAVRYLRIYSLGMPGVALYNFGNAVYSAAGNTRRPLVFLTMAGVVNVILNLFFVLVMHMTVDGVALASITSQYISGILLVTTLFFTKENYRMHFSYLRHFNGQKAKQILGIGVPAGCQNAIFALANLFIQYGVNSFDAVMVSGNSAAANADALVYDTMAAFYTACASFMGQNLGAKNRERVRNSYLICLGYSFGLGLGLGVLLEIFGRQFLGFFTTDTAVIDTGMKRLTIMGFSYCISAFMDCAIYANRALGKSVVPMVIVILGSCVFRVAWVYTVFAWYRTIPSLYLLYSVSWILTGIAETLYLRHVYRERMALL
ncbi:MAG: MATE family efflux transporter [Clostridiales bacterium]|nr:MATE family efflux transporter [Clostridiales bacterium]